MRKESEIRADIAKLNQELDTVKVYESKRNAAVNILSNLGWTHSPAQGWEKPKSNWKEFDKDSMSPLKVGDFVLSNQFAYRVTRVDGRHITGSRVMSANNVGCIVDGIPRDITGYKCKPVSHREVYNFINNLRG